jgi:acetyl-CoA acetyltransferase
VLPSSASDWGAQLASAAALAGMLPFCLPVVVSFVFLTFICLALPRPAAGNASPITDGAAAVVLASGRAVRQYGLPVVGRVLGFGDAAGDPRDFPTAPSLAIPKALQHAGGQVGGEALTTRVGGCGSMHTSICLPMVW